MKNLHNIQIKPLSVNDAWKGRRFKTNLYKSHIEELLYKLPKIKIDPNKPLSVHIVFGFTNVLSDIDNPIKPTLDILQSKYGINDRNIYGLTVEKEITKEPFIKFKITELKQ